MWRVLIYRVISKQHAIRGQTHPVCLHAMEKVESVDMQNDYEKTSKNEQIKRKQTCFLSFVKVFKFQDSKFKIVQKNF